VHSIAAANDCSLFADTFSSAEQPPQVSLHARDGAQLAWLFENRLDAGHPYAPYLETHVRPEFGTLEADDGSVLYYRIHRPSDFDPGASYPAIVQVYGGPLSQQLSRGWGPLSAQVYADAGYVVFTLDNRGSFRRGVAFEAWLKGRFGDIEVRDQLRGIEFLSALPYVDADRIGVTGWSYGGYMALMLLAQGGERIAAAVAGAPVTDFRLYDTHYTERYLGLPDENADGYELTSVFPWLDGIEGELLLVHGMADDNVFFTNSTKLMQALQQSNTEFELMTYPGETHFIRDRTSRLHADETMLRFFDRHLKPGSGPER
jgi:dipeptidyl-peptidase-4